jgi:hypothetical protein
MTLLIPFFRRAKPDEIVVILKARELARIILPSAVKTTFVSAVGFPCLPFLARVCLSESALLAIVLGYLLRSFIAREKDPGKSA